MSSSGNVRVSGGILSEQMLTGSQRYFKLEGADFSGTISDGTVEIPMDYGQDLPQEDRTIVTIADGHPVPNSAAEFSLRVVYQKATIVVVGVTDAIISFSLENLSMGWEERSVEPGNPIVVEAAAAMQAEIRALGTVTTPTGNVDLSSVTVTEVPFNLV